MTSRAARRVLLIGAVFFAGSFVSTMAMRSQAPTTEPVAEEPAPSLACWLNLDCRQAQVIRRIDPAFENERWSMQRALDQARTELAALFEDDAAPDDALRQQIEVVIEKHNALERRVAEHLIAVRRQLTSEDQKKLCSLCAKRVRGGRERCWGQDPGGRCSCGKACPPGDAPPAGGVCAPPQPPVRGQGPGGCGEGRGRGFGGGGRERPPGGGAANRAG